VLVWPCAEDLLSSGVTAQRLVSWEYANACPAHRMVADRAPGRRCGHPRRHLHRGGAVDRLSHRRPFIRRQLAEFADRHRPRVPRLLVGPAQCCAIHRPWSGTALALAPQAASPSPRRQITRNRRLRQPARTSVSSVPANCTHQPGVSTPEARGQRHDRMPGTRLRTGFHVPTRPVARYPLAGHIGPPAGRRWPAHERVSCCCPENCLTSSCRRSRLPP